jgi:hypothetical protein
MRPTEQYVEEIALAQFASAGVPLQRGVELDDAGERAGGSAVILAGRARAAVRKLNLMLDVAGSQAVVAALSRPPHPIARVNRVYGDKPGGLTVELIGLADPLADPLAVRERDGGQRQADQGTAGRSDSGDAVGVRAIDVVLPRIRLLGRARRRSAQRAELLRVGGRSCAGCEADRR